MNWQSLPLNTNKIYVTARLHGGCDIFVPVEQENQAQFVKERLHKWIHNQKLEILKAAYTPPEPTDAA